MAFLSIKYHSFCAIFLCVYGIIAPLINADEIQDNTFKITFKDITTNTWTSEGKDTKFTNAIATIANAYCSNNYDKCGLQFWNSTRVFKTSNVKISSGYPKQADNNLQIQFHVELPSGPDIRKNSTTVLPVSGIKMIIQSKKSTLNSLVGVTVKTDEDATSKPKVDNQLNYIMIPVSFGLLLLVILLAVCLHCCHKRKMEEIKATERRQYSSKQKAGNSNSQSPFLASPAIPKVAVKPQRRDDPETYVHYEDERINHYEVTPANNAKTGEMQSPHRRSKKKSQKHEKHKDDTEENVNNNHNIINKGYEVEGEQNQHIVNMNESDQERQPTKEWKKKKKQHKRTVQFSFSQESDGSEGEAVDDHESDQERKPPKERKKKKKKRHKRKVESPLSHESDESERECINATQTINEDDDILSRLPPPRKLPPLRSKPESDGDD